MRMVLERLAGTRSSREVPFGGNAVLTSAARAPSSPNPLFSIWSAGLAHRVRVELTGSEREPSQTISNAELHHGSLDPLWNRKDLFSKQKWHIHLIPIW